MNYYDTNTHKDYYEGDNLGHYQFTSLNNIINQFEIAYVGENKIIPKVKRADISFYAQRALQELSFDVFKSCKSQQITVPNSLKMPLPHDYVNYTKLTTVDSSGIEHILYPTSKTSNPFQIKQEDNGDYSFNPLVEMVTNGGFDNGLTSWSQPGGVNAEVNAATTLNFTHNIHNGFGGTNWGYAHAVSQQIDVSDLNYINLSATGISGKFDATYDAGVLRVGISLAGGHSATRNFYEITGNPIDSNNDQVSSHYAAIQNLNGDNAYLEWNDGDDVSYSKEMLNIDVTNHNTVYVLVTSFVPYGEGGTAILTGDTVNKIDNISVVNSSANSKLTNPSGNEENSSTWDKYKSITPSENNNDDYEDDTYWRLNGNRYGLDPQHAQSNGSFYIDCRLGKIHFSSNISGKDIILHYISDSRGTVDEMQVHKFAEEAVYKWIIYGILSTRLNIPENIIRRFKKEKFAETRKAKLRLSNIKLEEITQILRGKSKQIKH